MRNIIRNNLIYGFAAMLGLLVLFSTPTNRAVAQSNEPAISVSATNSAAEPAHSSERQDGGNSNHDMVVFCRSAELPAGETADDMVVIGGSATALGRVQQDIVAILGNVMVDKEAGGDAVAVIGNVKLGTNAVVNGDTVAILGNINLAPNTKVHGDVVAVGGAVERSKGSVVDGDVVGMPGFSWLGEWLDQCAFKLRPLAPQLGWLWAIAGVFLLVYLLIAIALPRPVQACVDEITRRPVTTILTGLLTKILLPFVFLILVATGIGIFVVPFLLIALMFAGMIGKVALLQYFGRQIGRQFNFTVMQKPLVAFLLGWILVTLLYLVPVLGLIVYGLTGMWALGAVVMAMLSGRRREIPEKPATPPPVAPPPAYGSPAAMAVVAPAAATSAPPTNPGVAPDGTPASPGAPETPAAPCASPVQTAVGAATTAPPVLHELLSYPKACFWERMGAAFLDMVVVGFITGIAHGPLGLLLALVSGPPVFLIVALAYFAGMWAWKGTTVGGIVLKLHVVRCDGQPMTFVVALVRSLAAAFSVIVLFLGFLWIAWDRDKQGWHDKIAGTIVVRLPRSMPLVCL
ncbi:MAG: RDD family protein [Verrucomicrobiia bacterium]